MAGVKTNVCIRATCQDAFAHGFRVVLPPEATSSNRPHLGGREPRGRRRYLGETPRWRRCSGGCEVAVLGYASADRTVASTALPGRTQTAIVAPPAEPPVAAARRLRPRRSLRSSRAPACAAAAPDVGRRTTWPGPAAAGELRDAGVEPAGIVVAGARTPESFIVV